MNELEINILNYIKNHGSFERPVPLKWLKSEFNISERGEAAIICQKTIWNATRV